MPYLKLLELLSSVAGVSVIAAAQPFVAPIKQGMDSLLNAEGALQLEVGLVQTVEPVTTGSYAVIATSRDKVDISGLDLAHDGVLVDADLTSISDSYFVIDIVATEHRADWYALPLIGEAYRDLMKDVSTGNIERVNSSFSYLRRLVSGSLDLIALDAQDLITRIDSELNLRLTSSGTSGTVEVRLPEPEDLMPW